MKTRKVIFVTICVVCCLVAVGILVYRAHTRAQVAKAMDVAIDYVEKKYPFDVECVGGGGSFEPWRYYVSFKTIDHEPLNFTVLVQHDFEISEERYSSSGESRFVADDFFHQKFEKGAEAYIRNVLSEDHELQDILVYCNSGGMFAFEIPADVDEASSMDELLQKMDFTVMLYYDDMKEDAVSDKLEDICKTLQEHGVNAKSVVLTRREEDGELVILGERKG